MIHDALHLPDDVELSADLCVVGSGAGGAMAAMVAAEAGLRVVLLEAGGFFAPEDMTQREEAMLPQLYWDGGARQSRDRGVRIHQGKGIGGSTLHNLNLCKRISPSILTAWQQDRGMRHLPPATWDRLYTEVEALLEVGPVPRAQWNRHNLLLEAGCRALGWQGGGLAHNRSGCVGSGFCEIGCSYDAKNNAAKVLIPRIVRARADVLAHCQAVRVEHDGRRVLGVQARAIDPDGMQPRGHVRVHAPRICVAGSATGTPALLLRSDVPDPSQTTGRGLRVHPAVVAAGDFPDPVQAWQGIPQTYECTEFLHLDGRKDAGRIWIVPAFGHPMGTATMLPGDGALHRSFMSRYAHMGVLTAMLHDETAGTVTPNGDFGLTIDYVPNAADRAELGRGLRACARLLFAAGATRVCIPTPTPIVLENPNEIGRLDGLLPGPGLLGLTAVHPMASVPMGDDPKTAAVDSQGRHHHLAGLWLADGSLFPTSIGVPPQLSIYALGLHVGRALVKAG